MSLNINNTAVTNYSDIEEHSIDPMNANTVRDQEETVYQNKRFATDWGYFNRVAKLKSAIIMKAIWNVGKGYTCDVRTKVILDGITGNGKQTFLDILFSMEITRRAVGDAYAEIVRDEKDNFVNLKELDPSSMRIIYGPDGRIKRYEQMKPRPTKGDINKTKSSSPQEFITFKPEDIFHLSYGRFAGEIGGRSIPEQCENLILSDDENFSIMRKLTRFQAVPFIIFKVKSDNATSIANFKANIKTARESGEDLIVPDDENILSWEVVQVSPSAILMEWRNSINNQFYQAVGMPMILFGSAGSTESGGKIEYLGHETVFEHDQLEIEKQIQAQLGLEINLNSPTSLLENLQTDESKDQQSAIAFQPNDVQGGNGA